MDNTTVIVYLNHKGGITPPLLYNFAKQACEWCMSQKITLVANHLPGYLNTTANRESRTLQDRWDWQIHPNIFQRINQKWSLILQILSEISHQQADVILVVHVPVWKAQAWYPVLLSLLFNYPCLIPPLWHPLLAPLSQPSPFQPQEVQLAVWSTSGDTAKQKSFLKKLQRCMASWRDKSNKSYNSLFHRWECWYTTQYRNPSSGPIVDVSNFIAE